MINFIGDERIQMVMNSKLSDVDGLKKFRTARTSYHNESPENRYYFRVSVEDLNEFITKAGITYREFFQMIMEALSYGDAQEERKQDEERLMSEYYCWPDPICAEMADVCDSLTSEQRAVVLDICKSMLPTNVLMTGNLPPVRQALAARVIMARRKPRNFADMLNQGERSRSQELSQYRRGKRVVAPQRVANLMPDVFFALERAYGTDDYKDIRTVSPLGWTDPEGRLGELRRQKLRDEDAKLVWDEDSKLKQGLIPAEYVLLYAKEFGLSPHWILGLDNQTPVLAKSGETEEIMDAFCLIDYDSTPEIEEEADREKVKERREWGKASLRGRRAGESEARRDEDELVHGKQVFAVPLPMNRKQMVLDAAKTLGR